MHFHWVPPIIFLFINLRCCDSNIANFFTCDAGYHLTDGYEQNAFQAIWLIYVSLLLLGPATFADISFLYQLVFNAFVDDKKSHTLSMTFNDFHDKFLVDYDSPQCIHFIAVDPNGYLWFYIKFIRDIDSGIFDIEFKLDQMFVCGYENEIIIFIEKFLYNFWNGDLIVHFDLPFDTTFLSTHLLEDGIAMHPTEFSDDILLYVSNNRLTCFASS